MSKSMPQPWIEKSISSILSLPMNNSHPISIRGFRCQIIEVDEVLGCFIINDSKYYIPVFLTNRCKGEIISSYANLMSLKLGLIFLKSCHFSTTLQCTVNRTFPPYQAPNSSLNITQRAIKECSPFAMVSDKIEVISLEQFNPFGSPNKITDSPLIRGKMDEMKMVELIHHLGKQQFNKFNLPSAESGEFEVDEGYSLSNPCLLSHAFVSDEQKMELRRLGGWEGVEETRNNRLRAWKIEKENVLRKMAVEEEIRKVEEEVEKNPSQFLNFLKLSPSQSQSQSDNTTSDNKENIPTKVEEVEEVDKKEEEEDEKEEETSYYF